MSFTHGPPFSRHVSNLSNLGEEMKTRKLPLLYDHLAIEQDYKLQRSLQSFLRFPTSSTPEPYPLDRALNHALAPNLAAAHHQVYFNPAMPANDLLPDGTDPLQSPGEPFVRRMWAGGSLRFPTPSKRQRGLKDRELALDGKLWVCHEFIRDVQIKGREGEEKVFVGIERRMASLHELGLRGTEQSLDDRVRQELWQSREEEFGASQIIERRNIVFMRERTPEEFAAIKAAAGKPGKMLRPQHKPDFEHTLSPTPSLLFRFSALTFNAHSIHLNPEYCRDVEGHRDLLVHGPLTLTLLMDLLGNYIKVNAYSTFPSIDSFEYRNLAPLYANEPLRLCGRLMEENKYELWAETPEGGIACKGIARTTEETKMPKL